MKNELNRIRAALAGMERGRGRRFSPEIRGRIAAAAAGMRKQGWSWPRIGSALDVPPETARRLWLAAGGEGEGPSGFVRVMVADDGAPAGGRSGLVLVSPNGYRVDGLNTEQAADLLARLG